MEDTVQHETPSETRRARSPAALLETENGFHPPPPPAILSRPVSDPSQRPPSPSPSIEDFNTEIPLVPRPSSRLSDGDEDDSLHQPDPLLPEFNMNDPPPSDSDEGDPPSDSDDDPLPSDSDDDPLPSNSNGRNSPSGDDGGDPPSSDEEEDPCVVRADMRRNLEFIQMIEDAILESQFGPGELEAFRNPQELMFSPSDDPDLLLSILNFVANINGSQDIYTKNRLNFQRRSPEVKILSYDQVK